MTLNAKEAFHILTSQDKSNMLGETSSFLSWCSSQYTNIAVDTTWLDSVLGGCQPKDNYTLYSVFLSVFNERNDEVKTNLINLYTVTGILTESTKNNLLSNLAN